MASTWAWNMFFDQSNMRDPHLTRGNEQGLTVRSKSVEKPLPVQQNSLYNGFTLVEMTVVLLLITLLASVAVRETAELGFQTRYEQTRERLEMIRQAILGNPKQIINGQQAVSGFVADMGRLPVNLRELIDQNYCTVDRTIDETTSATAAADCNSLAAGAWKVQPIWQQHPDSGLWYGWRGPYLNISTNITDGDAYVDGWGRTAINASDQSYGWGWLLDTPNVDDLRTVSYGKDQIISGNCSGSNYDGDCFQQILTKDYKTDIFPGITVQLRGRTFSMDSHCSNASYTTRTDCETNGGVWYGGCSEGIAGSPSYANKTTCEAAGKTWKSCSLTTHATQTDCETNQGIWYGEGFGCSDAIHSDKTACEAASKIWNSCSDKNQTTRAACETTTPASNWFGDGTAESLPRKLCLKVYYHKDGTIDSYSSTSWPDIVEDGTYQNLTFDFPMNTLIKSGQASIGIYYYRNTGASPRCTLIPYPSDNNPLLITVYPRTSLPSVIN